jgi:hypothetical protein
MNAYSGPGDISSSIVDLSNECREWSGSLPGCFNPWRRASNIHWVGSRADLNVVAKIVILIYAKAQPFRRIIPYIHNNCVCVIRMRHKY